MHKVVYLVLIAFGRGVTTLLTNCRYTSLNTLKAACKATQNVQQRQKEALMGQKSVPLGSLNGSHHSLCKTSSDSSEYSYQRHQTDVNTSMETLSMEFLRTEFASIFAGSNENLYSPEEQPSQLSSSSSEQSFHLRDSLNSNSSLRIDVRDSRLSSSSSEFTTSPTQKDPPRAESPSHRGSQTLPHHRKPSTPTRYQFICMLCLLSGCGTKNSCMIINLHALLTILLACLDF